MAIFADLTGAGPSPFAVFLVAASISMISPVHADADAMPWQSSLHTGHPLVGHIWDNNKSAFVSRDELLASLTDAELLLLGEKHDNPDHHRLRLTILERLMAEGHPVLLAMEMLTESQQAAIDSLAEMNTLPPSEDWQALLSWDDGWTWAFYEPALRAGLAANATIVAGNIGRETMMQVYRAEPAEQNQAALNAAQLQRLTEEIDVGHCGMLPAAQIPPMVRVQQARDEQMAQALMTPGDFGQRILLAGNFHIRHDLSVPNYLTADTVAPIAVAFLEVDPAATQVSDYLADAAGDFVYDFIWFTPAVRGDDYCADMTR
jgi:uncharacterized iron-regulated protein